MSHLTVIDGELDATGWRAVENHEQFAETTWQPQLQLKGDTIEIPQWFDTQAACEQWIAEMIIGRGWYPGEPSAEFK